MNSYRVFTMCPYLAGSAEGGICIAKSVLLRDLENINPDICMSRHFEVCRIYIKKLQELDILGIAMNGTNNSICNKNLTIL